MLTSIKSKLVAALAGMVLLLAATAGVGVHSRQRAGQAIDTLAGNHLPSAIALGQMSTALVTVQLWTRTAVSELAASGVEGSAMHHQRRNAALAEVERAGAVFTALPVRKQQAALWREYTARSRQFRTANDAIWAAVTAGNVDLARDRIESTAAVNHGVLEACNALLDSEADIARELHEETDRLQESANALLGGVLAGVLLALVFAAGVLMRAVLRRAAALQAGASVLAQGDQDADFGTHVDDEFGPLQDALQAVVGSMRGVSGAAAAVAKGDLDVEVPSRGPRDRMAASVNAMVQNMKRTARQATAIAGGDYTADAAPLGDKDELGTAMRKMALALRTADQAARESDWLKSGAAQINHLVLGQDNLDDLATSALSAIANHVGAKVGALYALEHDGDGPCLKLKGSYAYTQRKNLSNRFRLGEGLVGQAALERQPILIESAPADYIHIVSGLGETVPRNISVVPILFKGEVRGVLELGTLAPLGRVRQQYVEQAAGVVGTAVEIVRSRALLVSQQEQLRGSYEELQAQKNSLEAASRELKAQQAQLEQSNAELETQMARTVESETRLKVQQRGLEATNGELEQRNNELELQKAQLEQARRNLARQTDELATASKYKSEFLANMSHELRTPLNSLLLLARSLRDNPEGNLTAEQRECAGVIFSSGSDLLNLINEILDLAKVEAGRMELRLEDVPVADVVRPILQQFEPMARSQGLAFSVSVDAAVPPTLHTDQVRLGQVIKNLVGNALKFTDRGSVCVAFTPVGAADTLIRPGLAPERTLAIRVADTGIGIPVDKQQLIFQAFQQADSGDRRRYGGTGLGLSISREIVAIMGGEIQLTSEPGAGSTFTVFIPVRAGASAGTALARRLTTAPRLPAVAAPAAAPAADPAHLDDRAAIGERDRVVLVIEDDPVFNSLLVGEVRRRGFKALAALRGSDGLALAREYRPSGVILDINLPDTHGWAVLSALKQDTETRHIPVHIASAEDASMEGLRIGAIGHARKPLQPEDIDTIFAALEKSGATSEKHVLVVEDDPVMRRDTVRIVGNGNVHTHEVATGADALAALRQRHFDLVVLDLGLPDMQGLEMLEQASRAGAKVPPVIVYTVRELGSDEELALRQYADAIIIKDVRSQERLIDEVALFLHRVVSDLPEDKRQAIRHLHDSGKHLRGRKVLIVEDDMRTMFAMAKLLAGHGINPLKAANGEQALAALDGQPDVDLVLLDMMMPVMDGYETARRLRSQQRFAAVPIIALTAKAMKEDRQKCMDAGCTDYLSKPVDQDRLVSLLRV